MKLNAHFCTTDHLIIAPLPEIPITFYNYDKTTAKYKKYCNLHVMTYMTYFEDVFASAEVSNNCPNIENISFLQIWTLLETCLSNKNFCYM